jgi:REP element-mobilizing transposase RayT
LGAPCLADRLNEGLSAPFMPKTLKRYYGQGDLHFITFRCHHRPALLGTARARNAMVQALREVRLKYQFALAGYVVMPEHVHLLNVSCNEQTSPLELA